MKNYIFTSESVTCGHPDKICDQISDAILDAHLKLDPHSRVAVEAMIKDDFLLIAGEISSTATIDTDLVARETILKIGYDWEGQIVSKVSKQSPEINLRANVGAGDQGMVFGYATNETEQLMPAPILYANRLAEQLDHVRRTNQVKSLQPDGKTQVSFIYEDHKPVAIDTIIISAQHDENINKSIFSSKLKKHVIETIIPEKFITNKTKIIINPFLFGGPYADCGLTGRKIIVDTYGGMGRSGGGAFSGKDPSKVDRSAAYYARHIAKHIVAFKMAAKCEVQISYAIGVAKPVSVNINTFGTSQLTEYKLDKYVSERFDMRPASIIEQLDLLKPIYQETATYGHFGRGQFSWEKTV